MLRFVPNWVLWVVILAAAAASPFVGMLLLLLIGEVLWDVGSAIGPGPSLGIGAAVLGLLLFHKLRPRPPQPEAG
jgi:hypothetical protein